MSNFIEEVKKGLKGLNKGIPFGPGLEKLTKDIGGIQRKRMFAVGGAEKSGKTTLADYATVIQPYLYSLANPEVDIAWIYYSYEIDRISKEFDFTCYFLFHEFGITEVELPEGVLKDGKNTVGLSPTYLKSQLLDDNEEVILMSPDILEKVKTVYDKWIIPLFGSYDKKGILQVPGKIAFRDKADNPTGIYKDILNIARLEGTIIEDDNGRHISYVPKNPSQYRIVVLDHVRKLIPERGFQLKQTIDKMGEYMVILRNLLGYTFVPIIHTNRNMGSVEKMAAFKDEIYPTSDDVKDSGLENIILFFIFAIIKGSKYGKTGC